MPSFRYDLDAMGHFIELLDASIEEVATHVDATRSAVAGVLADYEGTAATAFSQFHGRWQQQTADHLTELRDFRAYVATARDNYADALRANLGMFG